MPIININGEDENLVLYGYNNRKELKEGDLFGVVVTGNISYILPKMTLSDVDISYEFEIWEREKISRRDVLLIFKKLSGNFAQEILTGKNFIIGDLKSINEELCIYTGNVESFWKSLEIVNNSHIAINNTINNIRQESINYPAYFIIDENFKRLFGKQIIVLSSLESTLADIIEDAEEAYNTWRECIIDTLQEIATTENLIRDFENDSQKKKELLNKEN